MMNSDYVKLQKASLYWTSTPVRTYTNAALKTCACVLVTAYWNNYYNSKILVSPTAPYHFVFDINGACKTGVITWTKTDGTVAVTGGATDVYFVGISLFV